ncbi:YdeI/OmpD-associated family protein [Aurantimicrobium minutum]|uniref:YdeI/OmpD-associated family protein n=1 Tax=Aurantimicrobium minutum TaxID=708131 RepID=UPI002474AEAA|nr:YdeI/OmpD-associated family protein [Aurantimicrobium minutum]MDH6423277.1 hypothetical protein [Aurantimicrobium minutum]
MGVSYTTEVLGEGNHASLLIPEWVLAELQANKRAPLKVTINGHTYQSTAVGVAGECRVVFPQKERLTAGAVAGETVTVHLELDSGYREVVMPAELVEALAHAKLTEVFAALSYSKRKEFARTVTEAKSEETKNRRVQKVLDELNKN